MYKITQMDFLINNHIKQNMKCNKYRTNQQIRKIVSIDNTTLVPKANAFPCGKFASYYPEGTFQIVQVDTSKLLDVKTQGIADNIDAQSNFSPSTQWANIQNQRYKNWMRLDSHQKIKKLWGKIPKVLSGNYKIKLTLNNQMPQIQNFYVSLQNNGALSGYNNQLCYVNFFYSIVVFLASLASFVVQKKWGHRKILKKKCQNGRPSNQIKIFLNSGASTPAVKME